ncbi:MAG: response regulator transcription factor [Lachnospiraceae bacterium]|nr:response regulator transcription factor [Lachnospiraceae bacterium]
MDIKMAVCDDMNVIHEIIKSYIENYQIKTDNNIHADYFSSGSELLKAYAENKRYDIILIDVVMPEKNGVETIDEIRREYDKSVTVYFLSDHLQYMPESFNVHARNYLLKPFQYNDFCHTLDTYFSETNEDAGIMILTKSDDYFEIMDINDIVYIKTQNEASDRRTLLFCSKHGLSYRKGRLSTIEQQLLPYGFVRVHKQFLVNLSQIKKFDSKTLILSNGESIPLRRGMSKKIQDLFSDGILIIKKHRK